ncbi:MAG: hypothetical protein E6K56_11130, partial [Ignavibacteria bacterium]
MKLFLPLLILTAQFAFSQQRYLVTPYGDAIPLKKGQSAMSVARQSALLPQGTQGCSAQATFGFTLDRYPLTTGNIGFHKDIMAEWFTAPASGTVDSVFWYMGGDVCAQDSLLYLRMFHSNIHEGHGPGYDGYPPPSSSTCWGYYINTNETEDGIAAFPEDATDTTWHSTVTSGPGPSYPPVGHEIWGFSGFPVTAHVNKVNSVAMSLLPEVITLSVGDPFFITFRINGQPGEICSGPSNRNTNFGASNDTDRIHTHNWKYYENVVTFQTGFVCKGWVARGDFNLLFWYVMTATSNLPPTVGSVDKIGNTTSTAASTVGADLTDCDPSNPAKAGVKSALLRYSVNGSSFQSTPMANIGFDRWEAQLPGEARGSSVRYRVVAFDSLGLSDSSVTMTY